MARRISSITTHTPVAKADTTAFLINEMMFCMTGGSTTQLTRFWEFSLSGQAASSSSPTFMLWSANSAVGSGAQSQQTGGTDSPMDVFTAALTAACAVGTTFATTYPSRDAANHKMNCSLNAFGGVFFWRGNRVEECPAMYGQALTLGQMSMSAFTGGTPGAIGGHVIYETQ